MTHRVVVSGGSVPALPRHVRLKDDRQRGRWVLLAPERVLMPDDIAVEILRRCNGTATVDDICDALAAEFSAPPEEIRTDVIETLQNLADKGFLDV